MKIRRVSRVATLKKYEDVLLKDLIPKYLERSQSKEPMDEVVQDLQMGVHNDPFVFTCMILDAEDKPIGFLVSHLSVSCKGRQAVVDHLYAPSLEISARILDMLMEKLEVHTVFWMTYRDPAAWLRLGKKLKHPLEMYGWTLRYKKSDAARAC